MISHSFSQKKSPEAAVPPAHKEYKFYRIHGRIVKDSMNGSRKSGPGHEHPDGKADVVKSLSAKIPCLSPDHLSHAYRYLKPVREQAPDTL